MSLKDKLKKKVKDNYIEQRYRVRELQVSSKVKFDDDVQDFTEKGYSFLDMISEKMVQVVTGFLFALPAYWANLYNASSLPFAQFMNTFLFASFMTMIVISTNVGLLNMLNLEQKHIIVNAYQFVTILALVGSRFALINDELIVIVLNICSLLSLLFTIAGATNRFEEELLDT